MKGVLKNNTLTYTIPEGDAYPVLLRLLNISLTNTIDALINANIKEQSYISLVAFLNYTRIVLSLIPRHKLSQEEYEEMHKIWQSLFERAQVINSLPKDKGYCLKNDILQMHVLLDKIIFALDKSGLGWQHTFMLATKNDLIEEYLRKGR